MVGDLTIRGTTREVVLAVEAPSPVTKGMRGLRHGDDGDDEGQAVRLWPEVQTRWSKASWSEVK